MKKLIAIIGSLLIIAGVVVAIVLLLPDHSENEKVLSKRQILLPQSLEMTPLGLNVLIFLKMQSAQIQTLLMAKI